MQEIAVAGGFEEGRLHVGGDIGHERVAELAREDVNDLAGGAGAFAGPEAVDQDVGRNGFVVLGEDDAEELSDLTAEVDRAAIAFGPNPTEHAELDRVRRPYGAGRSSRSPPPVRSSVRHPSVVGSRVTPIAFTTLTSPRAINQPGDLPSFCQQMKA